MGVTTKISWADSTFNPWEGCTKVSAGCKNCYAEARNRRFSGGENWGPGAPRRRTGAANWRNPIKWNAAAERAGRRDRVFCASLADWLDPEVPVEWLADLLNLIRVTPHLDWLLLTKRPELWRARLERVVGLSCVTGCDVEDPYGWAGWLANRWSHGVGVPQNVWIGTSVEDPEAASVRIPDLLDIPARVRFLSMEPLLEEVSLRWMRHDNDWDPPAVPEGIHWVIAGGESGENARAMDPEWALSVRDECQEAGVPFFFKQWGEWHNGSRVGKKAAGRLLDGREWNEFPNQHEQTK